MFILLKFFIELVTRRKNVQLPRSALFGIIFKDKKNNNAWHLASSRIKRLLETTDHTLHLS
jgi:hypothetical protein